MIHGNPAARVALPRVVERRMRILDEGEVWRLADAIEPRYRALILFLAYGGPRIGETSYLRVRHLGPRSAAVLAAHDHLRAEAVAAGSCSRR